MQYQNLNRCLPIICSLFLFIHYSCKKEDGSTCLTIPECRHSNEFNCADDSLTRFNLCLDLSVLTEEEEFSRINSVHVLVEHGMNRTGRTYFTIQRGEFNNQISLSDCIPTIAGTDSLSMSFILSEVPELNLGYTHSYYTRIEVVRGSTTDLNKCFTKNAFLESEECSPHYILERIPDPQVDASYSFCSIASPGDCFDATMPWTLAEFYEDLDEHLIDLVEDHEDDHTWSCGPVYVYFP